MNKNKLVKDCIILEQDKIKIVLVKLNVHELVTFTVVDVFDSKSSKGYQRPLDTKHVNSIYEYFKVEDNSVLPTSIILAANKKDICFKEKSIEIINRLRIIDGQHRVAALKKYIETYKEDDKSTEEEKNQYYDFVKWEYPVNIMILDEDCVQERYIEIRSFVDINKKGKTVSTDLADSSMKNIRRNFKQLYIKEAVHQICLLITDKLNGDEASAWFESIKQGDSDTKDRSIGVSSFKLSIMPIVRTYLLEKEGIRETYEMKVIEKVADELYLALRDLWKSIGDKWEDAFCWDSETKAYRVDLDYNIQKSLGVSAIHKLLKHCYGEPKDFTEAMKQTETIIKNSKITENDWIVGGQFSSYTSGSGHNKIKNILIESAQ